MIGGLNRLLNFYFQLRMERNICNFVLLSFSLVQQKPGTRIGWTSIIGIRSIMQKFTAVKKQKNLGMWWISRAGWTETGARFHPWQSRQNFSFVGKIIKAKMSGKTERFIRNILTINNHFDFFLRQNVYPVLTGCPISLGETLPSIGGWQGGGDRQLAGAVDCVNISSKNILMIICWFSSVTFPERAPLLFRS